MSLKAYACASKFDISANRGSYGGLVRNDQGRWLEGFCGVLGAATPLQAELWGLRQALSLVKDNGWSSVIIESDCLEAINLISGEEDVENHPCRALIRDCRMMSREVAVKLQHVLREANRCADKMAKLGSKQNEKLVRILVPPMELVDDLLADLEGTAFPRGF